MTADESTDTRERPIILHVDDDSLQRATLKRQLGCLECEVWEAENGTQALALAAQQPDLIVLDVEMPGISGFEICRRLKKAPETRVIPVLHLTGAYVADEDVAAGLESGADAYLTKPVPATILVATVRALLRIRRAEKSLEVAAREARLLAAQAEAESRAKGQFLSAVSHELITPLNAVVGMSGALLDAELPAEQADQAGSVRIHALRLLRLIENVLEFTRLDATQPEGRPTHFNLAETIRQCVVLFNREVAERGLSLLLDLGDGTDLLLRGDGEGLGRVLTNLLDNAVKFTAAGGIAVRVSGREEQAGRVGVTIDVEDTGGGIPTERQDRIYDAFAGVKDAGTRTEDGLGLGLCVSRQLVALMGGHLSVVSPVDRAISLVGEAGGESLRVQGGPGTRVSVSIEFDGVAGGTAAPEPVSAEEFGAVRALVVDDKLVNRKVATSILKRLACESVVACESGAEAIRVLQNEVFDIVLLDIQMPEMDGFEVVRRIRNPEYGVLRGDVPVIAVTANVQPECRDACVEAGMDGYLPKPITVPQVSAILRQHLLCNRDEQRSAGLPVTIGEVFDKAGAVERLGGNEEDFWDLVPVFMEELPKEMASLADAVEKQDREQVRFVAHSVKGASASLGAILMSSTAQKLETHSQDWDWDKLSETHGRLVESFKAFVDALESERPGP